MELYIESSESLSAFLRTVSLLYSEQVKLAKSSQIPVLLPVSQCNVIHSVMLFTIVLRVDSLPHLELSQTHYKLISSSSK